MTRNAALGAIVVTLIFGLIVGCQPGGDRIAALERELADTKSKCGMETQELRAKLAETEKKLEQEIAARRNAEASLKKAKVMK